MADSSWRSLGFLTHALILAAMSQMVAPTMRSVGAVGFGLSGLVLVWGLWPRSFRIVPRVDEPPTETVPLIFSGAARVGLLIASGAMLVIAYRSMGGNHLTGLGFGCWIAGLLLFLAAVWQRVGLEPGDPDGSAESARKARTGWHVAALAGVVLLAIFFRFHHLDVTPIEMTSDHAEKLYDVNDVLNGDRPIFFPRNTGREALQFYLTALLIQLTPLQISHLVLKVGTGIFGVLAIPFTYLLGRELYNRHIGLLAGALMAMGHWHVAITRVGLRFPFTAAFATPVLYFLLRAFRLNRRRDWIFVGLFLGVGLHTYIPMRIVPLLLLALCAIKLVFDWVAFRRGAIERPTSLRAGFWLNAVIGGVTSIIVFLPLIRYMMDDPAMFWMRAASRAAPADLSMADTLRVFWDNIVDAALMFSFIGDVVAVNTIGGSPVLGWVTGALFMLGLAYLLLTLVRDLDRRPVYLLVMLFTLLLPSTLSIQFPIENPSVVRTGGAPPVVMIIAALPLYWWAVAACRIEKPWAFVGNRVLAPVGVATVLIAACVYNYHWYFVRYHDQILGAIWNSRDLGAVIGEWVGRGGEMRNAHLMGYPHWVDTRLVAIHAGNIGWHNDIWPNEAIDHGPVPGGGRLFLLHPDDTEGLERLQAFFPTGRWETNPSSVPGRDKEFVVFEVPDAS